MNNNLLYLDRSAGFGQLGFEGFGVSLGDLFLDRLGSAVDQVLGFFQAQAGNFADDLDNVNLGGTGVVRMTSNSVCSSAAGAAQRRRRRRGRRPQPRGGGAHAEFLFKSLDKLGQFENSHLLDSFNDLLFAHYKIPPHIFSF
jgi:hypothetical protein